VRVGPKLEPPRTTVRGGESIFPFTWSLKVMLLTVSVGRERSRIDNRIKTCECNSRAMDLKSDCWSRKKEDSRKTQGTLEKFEHFESENKR